MKHWLLITEIRFVVSEGFTPREALNDYGQNKYKMGNVGLACAFKKSTEEQGKLEDLFEEIENDFDQEE